MGEAAPQLTREKALRAAMRRANVPRHDKDIWRELLDRSKWGSAVLEPKFQPRSVAELARWCGLSEATVLRGLNRLEEYGWIDRFRKTIRGRGYGTTYQVKEGRDYLEPTRGKAKSGAERNHKWRQKMRQPAVSEVRQPDVISLSEVRQPDVTDYVSVSSHIPGQGPVSTMASVTRGEVGGDSRNEYTRDDCRWEPAPPRDFSHVPDFEPGTYGHAAKGRP